MNEEIHQITSHLTISTVATLAKQLNKLILKTPKRLIFDLSGVDKVDSAGLALLIELLHLAKINQKELQFTNLPQQLFALAKFTGVDQLLFENQEKIRAK